MLTEIGRSTVDGDALAVKTIGQALHQAALVVAGHRHACQALVAQQVDTVVAGRGSNALCEQSGNGVAAVMTCTELRQRGVGRREGDGDPASVATLICILLRHAVLPVALPGSCTLWIR